MNLSKLVPLAMCCVLVACKPSAPEAQEPAADAPTPADAASETVAVYGDEAPVAIEAAKPAPEGDHAHNADGSHAEGEDHPHDAEGGHATEKAEAEHAHEPGQEAHDH